MKGARNKRGYHATALLCLAAALELFLSRQAFAQAFSQASADGKIRVQQTQKIQQIKISAERIPQIESIETRDRDFIFAQYTAEVAENYKLLYKGEAPAVTFYGYTAKEGDTIQTLSARLNIRPSSWIIINGISGADEKISGRRLILPACKGLFVPDPGVAEAERGRNSLEILLQKTHGILEENNFFCYNIGGRGYLFFPGEDFSPTENAFFLDTSIVLPVRNYFISSRYGERANPFGGGGGQFHRGMDLAVPEGSAVYACKGGTVLGTGENRVYGKWVQIDHGGGMTSFYAHLSFVEAGTKKGRFVRSGALIARSGSTGQVTGPHLHFEIRLNGRAVNPEGYGDF